MEGVILGVIIFGLLHGINPSHGWTVAILYSIKSRKPLLSGIASSGILAGVHFVSSIAVVVGYMLVTNFIKIPHVYLQYGAAVALAILAYMFWKEKGEDLLDTQHGHLHDFAEQSEHEHVHWHKGVGYHSHVHIHQKRILPSLRH